MINKIKLVLNQLKKLVSLKLSIITVVLNSKSALEKTIKSISNQDFKNFEYIIIDGKSTDGTQEIIKKYSHFIDKYISEEDNGLYYAMNKGINLAIGEAILFLNAGDLLCKQALSENIKIPSLIPVYYNNYRDKQVKLNKKFYKLGLPYCHQGIIFENKKLYYNCNYKIASDYDFYLRHNYKNKIKFSKVDGYILYDNKGLSNLNYKLRDAEIRKIIKKNFGFFWSGIFYFFVCLKYDKIFH